MGPLSGLTDVTRTTDGRLRGVVLSRSTLRRENAGLRFAVAGDRFGLSTALERTRDRFETDTQFDNDWTVLQVAVSRQMSERWHGEASVSHWDQEFTTAGEESEDRSLRLALYRSMGRASQFVMRFERNRRVSELNPFDENVIVVSFGRDFGD